MAFCRCALVAALACACARAAAWPLEPVDHPDDQPGNAVTLLQVASRVERRSTARAAHQNADLPSVLVDLYKQWRAARQNVDIPSVVVDLDAEPELRWRNVTSFYKQMGVLPKAWENQAVDEDTLRLVNLLTWDEDHVREMRGYLRDLGLPETSWLDFMKLQQLTYEVSEPPYLPFTKGCSALLAAMPNGTVVHGRNMDYGGAEVEVNGSRLHYPEVSIEGIFMRGGKPLYVSIVWPGDLGIHTAMRFGGWSFQQNTRPHSAPAAREFGMRNPGSGGFMLTARKVMETTPDFEEALDKLYSLDLLAPSYFAVAGPQPYQGAVITTDVGGKHEAFTPRLTRLSNGSSLHLHDGKTYVGWHVVQTNDDLDKVPHDYRRFVENHALARLPQDMVSMDAVFREMTGWLYTPLTVFTSVFVPASGYHKTVSHPENGH